ncbi:HDOD domain-containing protein [Catenovulum sediminis]|uniref:HDOD domain-containing protein n=1 Tax=Catenovulum sediminis TaxID=1740262 RepID=A0ABV1RDG3_9ALTE|nr:HDOD domain-containing protein [Catenovulum sediminis]
MADTRYSNLINTRFHDLLISYDFAKQHNGLNLEAMGDLFSEQEQRQLLDVEQAAKNQREADLQSRQSNKQKKADEINLLVSEAVATQLQDIETIFNKTLAIQDSIPAILDILAVRAASVARLEPLVNNLAWLESDLIQFVNLPVYRKVSQGKPVRVDKARTALGYIGVDNLKLVIPSFALRKWIPYSTEPFRLMKRKLWETGLGAGIACRKLAQIHGQDPATAFATGVFHELGKSALVRLYLRTFETIWKEQLEVARGRRLKEEHEALVDLEPDGRSLRDLMMQHTARLSAELVRRFELKRMNLAAPMMEYAQGDSREMSPMADILAKGIAYSRYKLLQRHGLIAKHEAKIYFKENKLSAQEVGELNKLSMRRLNLRLEQQ